MKMKIHKIIAVWLLLEGKECHPITSFVSKVSSNFITGQNHLYESPIHEAKCSEVSTTLEIGNICVFADSVGMHKPGKVIKFAYYIEKAKRFRNCSTGRVPQALLKDTVWVCFAYGTILVK